MGRKKLSKEKEDEKLVMLRIPEDAHRLARIASKIEGYDYFRDYIADVIEADVKNKYPNVHKKVTEDKGE